MEVPVTITPTEHEASYENSDPVELLIREARRKARRRRLAIGLIVCVVLMAGVLVAAASGELSSTPPRGLGSAQPGGAVVTAKTFVPTHSPDLILPTTLAAEHNGDVLILDGSRDQILQLTPGGRLSIFAGSGRQGFSGDGGLAVDAKLDFQYFSQAGLVVATDGTVYFLDDGNCRIRSVNAKGVIRTVLKVPLVHDLPSGTSCPMNDIAIAPSGVIYVSTSSDIDRVTPQGKLAWVAGTQGEIIQEPKHLTPSTIVMTPESIAFDGRGDLDIWSDGPKMVYQLSPSGKITNLGAEYATQLTTAPDGNVLAGGHGGEIDLLKPQGTDVEPYRAVNPEKVTGLNWGHSGFQENGITVTPSGAIYVDNAQGNGYGLASVLVRIATNGKAKAVSIRTPLNRTLPTVGAPGFPTSLYPAPRKSATSTFVSCPNSAGLEPFTPGAIAEAKMIASKYQSSQYASDLPVTDRSWWMGAFTSFQGADLGVHSVTAEKPTEMSAAAKAIGSSCGASLVRDSIDVSIGRSGYSDATGVMYLLDRNGHPMVYYAVIANND
jgi:sugar lactone lactonase YvrE